MTAPPLPVADAAPMGPGPLLAGPATPGATAGDVPNASEFAALLQEAGVAAEGQAGDERIETRPDAPTDGASVEPAPPSAFESLLFLAALNPPSSAALARQRALAASGPGGIAASAAAATPSTGTLAHNGAASLPVIGGDAEDADLAGGSARSRAEARDSSPHPPTPNHARNAGPAPAHRSGPTARLAAASGTGVSRPHSNGLRRSPRPAPTRRSRASSRRGPPPSRRDRSRRSSPPPRPPSPGRRPRSRSRRRSTILRGVPRPWDESRASSPAASTMPSCACRLRSSDRWRSVSTCAEAKRHSPSSRPSRPRAMRSSRRCRCCVKCSRSKVSPSAKRACGTDAQTAERIATRGGGAARRPRHAIRRARRHVAGGPPRNPPPAPRRRLRLISRRRVK